MSKTIEGLTEKLKARADKRLEADIKSAISAVLEKFGSGLSVEMLEDTRNRGRVVTVWDVMKHVEKTWIDAHRQKYQQSEIDEFMQSVERLKDDVEGLVAELEE